MKAPLKPSLQTLIWCLAYSVCKFTEALLGAILQDTDQRDVQFDAIIPDEILRKGWKSVLEYIRELRLQGAAPVQEVRVFLLGEGAQGKTSLRHALADPSGQGRTIPIHVDDRTVGIDIQVSLRYEVNFGRNLFG